MFGASGAQGGAVARRLAAEGHEVRGFSRTGEVPEGVEPFRGDLGDAVRVKEAFAGVTHASVTLPMVYEPATVAACIRNVIAGAAGVRRLVFNTGNRLPGRDTGLAAFDTRRAAVRAMRAAGLPLVVLRPPLYLENLLAPGVLEGGVLRYPLPASLPVAWLSHDDLGALTAEALTGDVPAEVDAGGPVAVTGPELAAAFGARFEEGDPDRLPPEVAATYRWIAAEAPAGLFGPGPLRGATSPAAWAAAHHWVDRHHRVIERWLTGEAAREEFRGFADAHAPEFSMVTPDGRTLTRARVLAEVEAAYGSAPGLRIEIRNPRVVTAGGPLVTVAYEEWHGARGRSATAVLRADGGAPPVWLRLHETWIT